MINKHKPNIEGIGNIEAQYKLISSKSHYYSSSAYELREQKNAEKYLFDNEINSNVMSWRYNDDYVEIEILEKCNIWAYIYDNSMRDNYMIIEKKINDKFVNVNDKYKTKYNNTKNWSKILQNVDKGTYRIKANGMEVHHAEWYLEKVSAIKYLIKQGDLYYSIKSDYYNEKEFDNTLVLIDDINETDKYINELQNLNLDKFSESGYNIIKIIK